jgi:hypothetical protein
VAGRARPIDIDPLRIGRFASAVVPELNVFCG